MEKNGVGSVYSHFNMASYEFFNTQQNLVIAAANARTSRTLFHELHHIQEVNLGKTHCAYKQCNAELDPAVLPDFSKPEGRTWDIAICRHRGTVGDMGHVRGRRRQGTGEL